MGWYPLLNYVNNSYLFAKLVIECNLSTGTDFAINFDLVKCITKNKYT